MLIHNLQEEFKQPLILPNNSRINGVEYFYQTTKPTTRGDNSTLVIGDRWYKSDDGTEWFWNGTYWLSSQSFTHSGIYRSNYNTASTSYLNIPSNWNVIGDKYYLIERVGMHFATNGTFNVNNNYDVRIGLDTAWIVNMSMVLCEFNSFSDSVLVTTNSTRRHFSQSIDQFVDTVTPGELGSAGQVILTSQLKVAVGAPQSFYSTPFIEYRKVYL